MTGIFFEDFEPCVPHPSYLPLEISQVEFCPKPTNPAANLARATEIYLIPAPGNQKKKRMKQHSIPIFEEPPSSSTPPDTMFRSTQTSSFSHSSSSRGTSWSSSTANRHQHHRLPLTERRGVSNMDRSRTITPKQIHYCFPKSQEGESESGSPEAIVAPYNARVLGVQNDQGSHRKSPESSIEENRNDSQPRKKVRFSAEIHERIIPGKASPGASGLDTSDNSYIDPAPIVEEQCECGKPSGEGCDASLICHDRTTSSCPSLQNATKVNQKHATTRQS